MNLFQMKGAWGPVVSLLYNRVVVPALSEIYSERFGELFPDGLGAAGTRVLDLGCGPGHASGQLAARFPDLEFVGVDLSPGMIATARRRHDSLPNLEFREGDAMALPFDDASFERGLTLASIKHWPDPALGLRELARVLRPYGELLVLECDRRATWATCRHFVRRWRRLLPFTETLATAYFHRFVAGGGLDVDRLRALLEGAGFDRVHVEAVPDFPAVVGRAVRCQDGA